jgi:hypothetical protein
VIPIDSRERRQVDAVGVSQRLKGLSFHEGILQSAGVVFPLGSMQPAHFIHAPKGFVEGKIVSKRAILEEGIKLRSFQPPLHSVKEDTRNEIRLRLWLIGGTSSSSVSVGKCRSG